MVVVSPMSSSLIGLLMSAWLSTQPLPPVGSLARALVPVHSPGHNPALDPPLRLNSVGWMACCPDHGASPPSRAREETPRLPSATSPSSRPNNCVQRSEDGSTKSGVLILLIVAIGTSTIGVLLCALSLRPLILRMTSARAARPHLPPPDMRLGTLVALLVVG